MLWLNNAWKEKDDGVFLVFMGVEIKTGNHLNCNPQVITQTLSILTPIHGPGSWVPGAATSTVEVRSGSVNESLFSLILGTTRVPEL